MSSRTTADQNSKRQQTRGSVKVTTIKIDNNDNNKILTQHSIQLKIFACFQCSDENTYIKREITIF